MSYETLPSILIYNHNDAIYSLKMSTIPFLCSNCSVTIHPMVLALYLMATCATAVIQTEIRAIVYRTNESTQLATIVRIKGTVFRVI